MNLAPGVTVDVEDLGAFCRANGIKQLRLFGSALGENFNASSDIDLLVEFQAGRVPGLVHLSELELELKRSRQNEARTCDDISLTKHKMRGEVTRSPAFEQRRDVRSKVLEEIAQGHALQRVELRLIHEPSQPR